jgi:peptidoglycan/xylan/chitin deacetylase (PgdA/CDA1 family)
MSSIAILTYHSLDTSGSVVSVTPQNFADQMACLADLGFRGVSLWEAVTYHELHGMWPERAVVLTFDDGYATVHDVALPILVRHGYTATVFVVSHHMEGQNDWAPPPPGLGLQDMLSWHQVAELSAAGIEIASHTQTHPDLQLCSVAEAERQIRDSCADIEGYIGLPVQSFAYPFGQVSPVSRHLVQRTFRAACSTVLKRATSEPLEMLPRVDMYYIRSTHTLRRLLQGQLDRYLTIRRWGRSVRRLMMPSTQQGKAVTSMS